MTTMMATRKYEFTSEVDKKLVCSVCLEVAEDPKQEVNCGQLFCTECVEKVEDSKCPFCRTSNPNYFKDKKSK